ncbi:hypothetical protein QFZ31_000241 [Neobacillus niacini]|nr:hypothetical protein [Neobacillus niacini]
MEKSPKVKKWLSRLSQQPGGSSRATTLLIIFFWQSGYYSVYKFLIIVDLKSLFWLIQIFYIPRIHSRMVRTR